MVGTKFKKEIIKAAYHVNAPVEIDHRISPRTIFIVLVLLTRNYISTLHNDHRRMFTVA